MNRISPDGAWIIEPDFDGASSRQDTCSVTGQRKRASDVGVFRPVHGFIEYEGNFDISQLAIETAAWMIDWIPPQDYQALKDRITELEGELEMSRAEAFKKAADAVRMAGVRSAKADV